MADAQPTTGEWEQVRSALREAAPQAAWQTWLSTLTVESLEDGVLKLGAPSDFHVKWIQEKHMKLVNDAVVSVYGDLRQVDIAALEEPQTEVPDAVISPEGPQASPVVAAPTAPPQPSGAQPAEGRLLDKYTFDNFIVGPSNRFAWAAAMAVAENPGRNYNPLFIYGGAGLGKTHLLHAVGHHAIELVSGRRARYISSENFFNEFIEGIRRKRMDEFKARYRTIDVLLLDDVQFFEGKEQILEEFFHTFNSLYESGKQIVITSDRPPKNLSTLEDRLRSRFEWGLMTDIQPPDIETRIAILRRNADYAPKPVPEDVLAFIAGQVQDNIREVEGALTRVTAYAALTNQDITLDMAQEVLSDLATHQGPRQVTPEEIMEATALSYGFTSRDLTGSSRRQPLALARQVAMYLTRDLTDLSLPKIGRLFGGRDHTTVIHAVEKITGLLKSDRDVFERVNALTQNLRRT